jgi:hypothetical protein
MILGRLSVHRSKRWNWLLSVEWKTGLHTCKFIRIEVQR